MQPASCTIGKMDFVARWNERQSQEPRSLPDRDQLFWASKGIRQEWVDTPRTLEWLIQCISCTHTLLDIGAGSGRYSLPLAKHVRQVTAVDYSPEMLGRLEHLGKLEGLTGLQTVEGNYHDLPLQPHDVVLAAWILYSTRDLHRSLERLVSLARNQLLILEDEGKPSPHSLLRRPRKPPLPGQSRPALLEGALKQLGFQVILHSIEEHRTLTFSSEAHLMAELFPEVHLPEQRDGFLEGLQPHLQTTAPGLCYAYPFEVKILQVLPG